MDYINLKYGVEKEELRAAMNIFNIFQDIQFEDILKKLEYTGNISLLQNF
jgi:hypothetical protein